MGKPIEQAIGEVDFCVGTYAFYADNAASLLADEPIELAGGEGSAFVRRSSVGVLLGIMPWNYPYYQVARFAGSSLVIGNTIRAKHARSVPSPPRRWRRSSQQAGFPADAYIRLSDRDQRADRGRDTAIPRMRGVSLTGSERAGAAVAEIAGATSRRWCSSWEARIPFHPLEHRRPGRHRRVAVGARLENTGRGGNAAKRFIVVDELYEPFLEKFTAALSAVKPGGPRARRYATIGPLSSTLAGDRLEEQVKRAVEQGATLLTGGERDGNSHSTTCPDGHDRGKQRRVPGGVLRPGRLRLSRGLEDEASSWPTTRRSASVVSSRRTLVGGQSARRRPDRGRHGVRRRGRSPRAPSCPSVGVKRSGFGRDSARYGADEFVNKKLIRVAPDGGARPAGLREDVFGRHRADLVRAVALCEHVASGGRGSVPVLIGVVEVMRGRPWPTPASAGSLVVLAAAFRADHYCALGEPRREPVRERERAEHGGQDDQPAWRAPRHRPGRPRGLPDHADYTGKEFSPA